MGKDGRNFNNVCRLNLILAKPEVTSKFSAGVLSLGSSSTFEELFLSSLKGCLFSLLEGKMIGGFF